MRIVSWYLSDGGQSGMAGRILMDNVECRRFMGNTVLYLKDRIR